MTAPINQEGVTKLIQAWNTDATRRDDNEFSHPQYKGLALSFDAGEWREAHPQEFPEFTEVKRTHPFLTHNRYDCSEWYLPASIIKMVLECQVTQEEVSQFITLLLKKQDTIDKRIILPEEYDVSGGIDSPKAEPSA